MNAQEDEYYEHQANRHELLHILEERLDGCMGPTDPYFSCASRRTRKMRRRALRHDDSSSDEEEDTWQRHHVDGETEFLVDLAHQIVTQPNCDITLTIDSVSVPCLGEPKQL